MTGAAAQPRRLAVLALLARAGRPGITREKILALLWPDEPEERARRSLNQAVYSLRRDLGDEDALLGAKDLRLNLDRIEVDTIEFDDAIKGNDVQRAIRLYDGPFLDGLFVPRAAEFERWVEVERAALALDFARALERAAIGAGERGDHHAAVDSWRKLAATDPLNGRVALSVMTALVAAGDGQERDPYTRAERPERIAARGEHAAPESETEFLRELVGEVPLFGERPEEEVGERSEDDEGEERQQHADAERAREPWQPFRERHRDRVREEWRR